MTLRFALAAWLVLLWSRSSRRAGTSALVPARTLQEVGKTFAHGGDISIAFSGSGDREIIAFSSGNKTVTSLLIKGNFPPVRRLFPAQTEHHSVVNTADLAEAVRRVALVLDRSAPLRFTFGPDGVSMDASGTEQARATESVDATLNRTVSSGALHLADACVWLLPGPSLPVCHPGPAFSSAQSSWQPGFRRWQ